MRIIPFLLKTAILGLLGLTFAGLVLPGTQASAEDFKKLSAAQIRAKFTGMQFTDEIHWGETYLPGGKVTATEMGRKREGRWKVEKDQLCTDYGKDGVECYEVWLSGRNVQLRRPGESRFPLEGVLTKASNRP